MAACQQRNCSVYNESYAFIPLHFSYASYCEQTSVADWSCASCLKASSHFKVDKVILTDSYLRAFIGYDVDANQIVIAFRGTYNYKNWFTDLDYKQISYPNVENGYVHEGFFNAYTEIQSNGLIASLQSLLSIYNTSNVLITGHSMGGALAELCALDLVEEDTVRSDINIEIYTFGCPRWANKELAQYSNNLPNIKSNWRIVNKNDPVPILLGQDLGTYGFHHTATEVLYTNIDELEYIICDGTGEDPRCGYNLWTEHPLHLHTAYLNVSYEDCAVSKPVVPAPELHTINNNIIPKSFRHGTHWQFSLLLMFVGCILAAIYYVIIRKCYRNCNEYESIKDLESQTKSPTRNVY